MAMMPRMIPTIDGKPHSPIPATEVISAASALPFMPTGRLMAYGS